MHPYVKRKKCGEIEVRLIDYRGQSFEPSNDFVPNESIFAINLKQESNC